MKRALLLLLLAALAACKGEEKKQAPAEAKPAPSPVTETRPPQEPPAAAGQTMKQAMELVCDAPNRASVPAGASDSERARAVANWIGENVTNPEAVKLLGSLASVMPEDRGSMLSDEAKKHGIGTCALAQMK